MYICGKNSVREVLNNGKKIKQVYLYKNFNDGEFIDLLSCYKINYLDRKQMDSICENNQGIILEINDYEYKDEKYLFDNLKENPFIVILDHLQDPHNFGAIIRTCEAAGVDYIVIPKDRGVKVTSTVMKTSVGALENINIVIVTNLNIFINKLKKKGIWIVGTDMENSTPYDELDYRIPTALVIGSEGFGMSRLVKENCDYIARIPMFGKVNSLNSSVATAVMIYEVIRQRK